MEVEGGVPEVSSLYVSYVETPGGEGLFSYLLDADAAAVAVASRSPETSQVTRIQKINKQAGQPVVEILCFCRHSIAADRSREIAQKAVDWLMEEGLLAWNE